MIKVAQWQAYLNVIRTNRILIAFLRIEKYMQKLYNMYIQLSESADPPVMAKYKSSISSQVEKHSS